VHSKKLGSVCHSIDVLNSWAGKIVSWLVVGMIVVLLYEVVLRYCFNSPTIWAHETSQLMFGAYIIVLGAYTHFCKAHVSMDIFYTRWSLRTRAILDVSTFIFFLFFCGVILWYGADYAANSVAYLEQSHSSWGPPIWEVKLLIPIGAFLFLLQGLAKFIRDLTIATTGKELE